MHVDFLTALNHNGLQYIGLMLLCALLVFAVFRFLRGPGRLAMHGLLKSKDARIQIVESLAFHSPSQRTLLLIKRDGVEHLVMIGGPNDLVIEQTIIRGIPMGTVPGLSHAMAAAHPESPQTGPEDGFAATAPADEPPDETASKTGGKTGASDPSPAASPDLPAAPVPAFEPDYDIASGLVPHDHDLHDDIFAPTRAEPQPSPVSPEHLFADEWTMPVERPLPHSPAPLPPVSADPPRRAATFDPLSRPRTTPLPPLPPRPGAPLPTSSAPTSSAPAAANETPPPAFHFALDHDEITSQLEEALRLDFHADFDGDVPDFPPPPAAPPSMVIPAEASPPPRAGLASAAVPPPPSFPANSPVASPASPSVGPSSGLATSSWLRNRRSTADSQAPRPTMAQPSTLGRGPRELQADRDRFDTLIAQMTRQQANEPAGEHAPEPLGEPQPPPAEPSPPALPPGPSHPAGGIDDAVDAEMALLLGELSGKPPGPSR